MNFDLREYRLIYKNVINNALLDKITAHTHNANIIKHSYADYNQNPSSNDDQEFDVCYISEEIWPEMEKIIWNCLQSYCTTVGDFIQKGMRWNGFTIPRINIYNKNTIMSEHVDHIHNIFDGERKGIPTFTVLGLIKNAEEGGEFILWGEEVVNMEHGDIIIFPSNFMYKHRVDKILKGQRISFVSWAW